MASGAFVGLMTSGGASGASTPPPPATTAPTTLPAATTTSVAPTTTVAQPPSVIDGINWIQAVYASPCGDATVQLIGGSAVVGDSRAVLDSIAPLNRAAGLVVAFMSCHGASGEVTQVSAVLVKVTDTRFVASLAELRLGAGTRIIDVDMPEFSVALPDPGGDTAAPTTSSPGTTGTPQTTVVADTASIDTADPISTIDPTSLAITTSTTIAPPRPVIVRRYEAGLENFDLVDERKVLVDDGSSPVESVVGSDVDLVRTSVSPLSLCYRWNNVSLQAPDPPEPNPMIGPADPDVETLRLALIVLTGRWIEPTTTMSAQMAQVASAYQESHELVADGIIGPQTTSAIAADLGCPEARGFRQVDPPQLGPRRFRNVGDLVGATGRYAVGGRSGNPSLDALLTAAGWQGADALFLGCDRYESPDAGLACRWSGTTPLVLVGLVADSIVDGVVDFAVLYARTAA